MASSISNSSTDSNSTLSKPFTASSTQPVDPNVVRTVTMAECTQAATCLAEAFAKDEVARYMVDMTDKHQVLTGELYKLHLHMMIYITKAHIMRGLVTTIGPNFNAVALWMPPGQNMDDCWTILRSGMWKLFFKLDKEGRTRWFKEFFPLLHETMERVLPGREAFYLVYLGTRPGSERTGYGRKLVEHGAALADAVGLPCYLESSATVNIPFYAKSGFEYIKEVYLQRSEKPVSLAIMVREPKPMLAAAKSVSSSSDDSASNSGSGESNGNDNGNSNANHEKNSHEAIDTRPSSIWA